jgi:hypothetical protein
MKRIVILTLAAGLLSAGVPALMADASTNSPGQTVTQTPNAQSRQADRRKLMKILGLTSKDLKGLTPEDRRAKVKDATNQKISQLQVKVADGSISTEEQSDLAFLQQSLQHGKSKKSTSSN